MDLLDIDINDLDSIFGEQPDETPVTETPPPTTQTPTTPPRTTTPPASTPVLRNVRTRGIELTASYLFRGAINPGWEEYPWELDGSEHFSWAIGSLMRSTFGINARISEAFRVRSVLRFQVPSTSVSTRYTTTSGGSHTHSNPGTNSAGSHTHNVTTIQYPIFTLEDFFFDYNFSDKVFLRAGKFIQAWGISSTFNFTNLLARIPVQQPRPAPTSNGPSYIAKFDIPIGVGGLQLLALTRVNLINNETPTRDFIGYGAKYNLALPWADFTVGAYDQNFMATRGFFSAKTTVFDTELFSEWLVAENNHTDGSIKIAYSLGFVKSFFDNKLDINAEFFYNGEESTEYFRPEDDFRRMDITPFPEGFNYALGLLYRGSGKWNPRYFTRLRYGEESFSLIPGLRLTPYPNTEVYFAVPIALGNKDGVYYKDSKNVKGEIRPFSVVLQVTFRGSVRVSHYY
ncbi:MAG: hypothetical protein FWD40_03280 [Treponema sp.]|nr:hypothetical protein [Treponema sp.]